MVSTKIYFLSEVIKTKTKQKPLRKVVSYTFFFRVVLRGIILILVHAKIYFFYAPNELLLCQK